MEDSKEIYLFFKGKTTQLLNEYSEQFDRRFITEPRLILTKYQSSNAIRMLLKLRLYCVVPEKSNVAPFPFR